MAVPHALTQELLARAHPPDSVNRIFGEKIQHRTLHLRRSSPPPSALNARNARRKARLEKKEREKQRPKPLSSRQRRNLGLHDVPATGQSYDIYAGLNQLWAGYARELLGREIYTGGTGAAAKLASAELHGATAEVVRSRCAGRVGIKGIIVRDRKFVIEIITQKRGLKCVPKDGTTFRISVPAAPEDAAVEQNSQGAQVAQVASQIFAFEVHGDQLMLRSADRANRKFKQHFLKNL
ncbi:ribonuclease P protein subunit p29 [Beauveria bassiana ARSEF 2860]|uniref:Ribonuclease P protein subunit n=1 Tax=Beauveria bassiana (strain ARSEF 2860) TaxID=655819 RepID=J4KLG9_BEAB2|nr:ribonuclease P protein subunit p29 [Beauveria bassiana ARSEF 2860]EJP62184.1 ribonuclease P protein subunit p29 [Beauveria bassiana ARSEF 2860]